MVRYICTQREKGEEKVYMTAFLFPSAVTSTALTRPPETLGHNLAHNLSSFKTYKKAMHHGLDYTVWKCKWVGVRSFSYSSHNLRILIVSIWLRLLRQCRALVAAGHSVCCSIAVLSFNLQSRSSAEGITEPKTECKVMETCQNQAKISSLLKLFSKNLPSLPLKSQMLKTIRKLLKVFCNLTLPVHSPLLFFSSLFQYLQVLMTFRFKLNYSLRVPCDFYKVLTDKLQILSGDIGL